MNRKLTIWVTGSSRGIGLAIAERFALDGRGPFAYGMANVCCRTEKVRFSLAGPSSTVSAVTG